MKSKEPKQICPVMITGVLPVADADGADETVDPTSLVPTDNAN